MQIGYSLGHVRIHLKLRSGSSLLLCLYAYVWRLYFVYSWPLQVGTFPLRNVVCRYNEYASTMDAATLARPSKVGHWSRYKRSVLSIEVLQ